MFGVSIIFIAACIMFILFVIKSEDVMSVRIDQIVDRSINGSITQMILIFILAGAFASTLQSIGSIDSIKMIIHDFVPKNFVLLGIFISSALVATAIGTSVGTVSAMAPIVLSVAGGGNGETAIAASAVIAGAYLGDNVSMISDTTIAAVKTQCAKSHRKFLLNLAFIIPSVIIASIVYILKNFEVVEVVRLNHFSAKDIILIAPYVAVVAMGLARLNPIFVLLLSIFLSFAIGFVNGIGIAHMVDGCVAGMSGMFEISCFVIVMSIVNSGIKYHGWIARIEKSLSTISSKNGAGVSYFMLLIFIGVANIITANNTIAIIMCGDIANVIRLRLGLDADRMAVFIDATSCTLHSMLPYAPQIILASAICKVGVIDILMNSYYAAAMLFSVIVMYVFNFARILSKRVVV